LYRHSRRRSYMLATRGILTNIPMSVVNADGRLTGQTGLTCTVQCSQFSATYSTQRRWRDQRDTYTAARLCVRIPSTAAACCKRTKLRTCSRDAARTFGQFRARSAALFLLPSTFCHRGRRHGGPYHLSPTAEDYGTDPAGIIRNKESARPCTISPLNFCHFPGRSRTSLNVHFYDYKELFVELVWRNLLKKIKTVIIDLIIFEIYEHEF